MGWVIGDIVTRLRHGGREYQPHEWEQFCHDYGVAIWWERLPTWLPGFIAGDTLVLDPRLEPTDRVRIAWHELGHWAAHVGDFREWGRLSCGDLILRKMERQADEFAATFPVSEGD